VTWRPSRGELAVTYEEPGRGTVSRVIAAPPGVEQALVAAVDLAVNLVRDEAGELLGPAPVVPPAAVVPRPAVVASPPASPTKTAVALFYPLASNAHEPDARVRFAFGAIYGKVGGLDGLQLGLGANQVSGPVTGAQVALGFNLAGDSVSGFQASFGFNHASGALSGFQAAAGYNGTGELHGLQLTLGMNHSEGLVHGLQAAGALNIAEDVDGLQFAAVNVARKVRGVQVGLVNFADDVEGIPLGLISVTRSGGVHPVVWAGTQAQGNVGVKFATRYTYTLISGSARRETQRTLYGPGAALGARIPFLPVYFETDLGASYLFAGPIAFDGARGDDLLITRLRVLLGGEIHRHFSVFAGVAMTLRALVNHATTSAELGPELFGGVQL
jgi:hypothetical protein